MYKSSIINYFTFKFFPLIAGSISIIISISILLGADFDSTNNSADKKSVYEDAITFFIIGFAILIFYFKICWNFVRMKIYQNHFEFKYNGMSVHRKWVEVEKIKRYWMVAPPFYSVKFENDERVYYFNSGWFYITLPFYVLDLSEMGEFIKNRKKEIESLKELRNK